MAQQHTLRTYEKQTQALRLALAGISYQAIAEAVGYNSKQAAWKAVKSALNRSITQETRDVRMVQNERLNVMLRAIWEDVVKGNEKAIDLALRIEARRSRLMGTDAPIKIKSAERRQVTFVVRWGDDGNGRATGPGASEGAA